VFKNQSFCTADVGDRFAPEADLGDCPAGRLSLHWLWGGFSVFSAEANADAARLAVIEHAMGLEVQTLGEIVLALLQALPSRLPYRRLAAEYFGVRAVDRFMRGG
jgi:hypothetical protein